MKYTYFIFFMLSFNSFIFTMEDPNEESNSSDQDISSFLYSNNDYEEKIKKTNANLDSNRIGYEKMTSSTDEDGIILISRQNKKIEQQIEQNNSTQSLNRLLSELMQNTYEADYWLDDESDTLYKKQKVYKMKGPVVLELCGMKETLILHISNDIFKKRKNIFHKKTTAQTPSIEVSELSKKEHTKSPRKKRSLSFKSSKEKQENVLEITTSIESNQRKKFDDFYSFIPYKNLMTQDTHIEIKITDPIQTLMIRMTQLKELDIETEGNIDFYSDNAIVTAQGGWVAKYDEYHESDGNFFKTVLNHKIIENNRESEVSSKVKLKTVAKKLIQLYPLHKKDKES